MDVTTQTLEIVRAFLKELGNERALGKVAQSASITRDLGIDSLGRVELFSRLEAAFSVQLSDTAMGSVETVQDLIDVIKKATPHTRTTAASFAPTLAVIEHSPTQAKTLIEVLFFYAENYPDRPHVYLQDEHGDETIIRYGELFSTACSVAQGLISKGLKPHETVSIMLPTSSEFFYAFFGILLAGGIPVPIYPPFRPDQIEEYIKREAVILNNAEARFLITFQEVKIVSELLRSFVPSLKEVTTVATLTTLQDANLKTTQHQSDIALIQYTSGSTGSPKGVVLTHGNVLANLRAVGLAANITSADVVVSWLPLYHDMGLIGAWLGSLYYGVPLVSLSPLTFLAHPERWLWAIHYHRATISAGPNFAYELCINRIKDEAIEGLDLSSWRLAFNGAEGVYPNTIRRFIQKFSRYGFKAEAVYPVYGLAESSVALAFPPMFRAPRIDAIEREAFEKKQLALPVETDNPKEMLEFVCCGKALPGHDTQIVDEHNQILPERAVGHLQFKGPSAMQGYFHNEEATRAVYHDGWIDTGDLAYQANGEIFIVGRKKDVIIKAGRNLYPIEIEELASGAQGVRKGCVVAFGVHDPAAGTEKLIVVAETRGSSGLSEQEIVAQVIEKVVSGIGIPPDQVVLVAAHTIPKTSSGKLRRSTAKQIYLTGELNQARPPFLQVMTLLLSSRFKKVKEGVKLLSRLVYGSYVGVTLLVAAPLVWLMAMALPRRAASLCLKQVARFLLGLFGCPVRIEGLDHLQGADTARVYVANHASYIDALVLMAVLPPGVAFVGKEELFKTPLLGTFLKKLGYIAVSRADFTESLASSQTIAAALQNGQSIAIFPEGTFTYATGVRPFKLGAFKIAAQTGALLVPVTLQGTRSILRDGSVLPSPAKINVHISKPIKPQSQEWHEVVRLSQYAHKEIVQYSGEQALR